MPTVTVPLRITFPCVGVSSNPMMFSNVDLPQPEGPHHAEEFALFHFHIDIFESLCLDLFCAVYLVDSLNEIMLIALLFYSQFIFVLIITHITDDDLIASFNPLFTSTYSKLQSPSSTFRLTKCTALKDEQLVCAGIVTVIAAIGEAQCVVTDTAHDIDIHLQSGRSAASLSCFISTIKLITRSEIVA